MTEEIECEFGCECDTAMDFRPFDMVLDESEQARLIQEKIQRARRYIQLQERIGGQFESD